MLNRVIRIVISLVGFILGFTTYLSLAKLIPQFTFGIDNQGMVVSIIVGIIIGILFYLRNILFFKRFLLKIDFFRCISVDKRL